MPARSIGTATISFGLVSVPVSIYSASESKASVSFNMLHKKCGTRLKQQYICPKDNNEVVTRDETVKGYEFAKDQYVVLTAEELKALEEKATSTIDVLEFVPLSTVDREYMDKVYYLGPDKGGDRAYRLLAAGGRLVYTGHAVTYHKEWRDWKSRRMTERGYGIGAGAAFMKYVRCGDVYGIQLFATWIWELGVRRLCAGLLKWRSVRPTYLGYCQLVYPWIGVIRSFRASIDRQTMLYVESRPAADRSARPREASAR